MISFSLSVSLEILIEENHDRIFGQHSPSSVNSMGKKKRKKRRHRYVFIKPYIMFYYWVPSPSSSSSSFSSTPRSPSLWILFFWITKKGKTNSVWHDILRVCFFVSKLWELVYVHHNINGRLGNVCPQQESRGSRELLYALDFSEKELHVYESWNVKSIRRISHL